MRALCWNGGNDLRVETVPDSKIVEAYATGPQYACDRAKQALRLHTERPGAARSDRLLPQEGTLVILGV